MIKNFFKSLFSRKSEDEAEYNNVPHNSAASDRPEDTSVAGEDDEPLADAGKSNVKEDDPHKDPSKMQGKHDGHMEEPMHGKSEKSEKKEDMSHSKRVAAEKGAKKKDMGEPGKPCCYTNRELSWLKFNERVLEEAERDDVPLCERLMFLSIFQTNLDEFFMVRVGSLSDQIELGEEAADNKTGMTPKEQINAVLEEVSRLNKRKDRAYSVLMGMVGNCGIRLVNFRMIEQDERDKLEAYFMTEIMPLLSPIIVGNRQPCPFIRNKDIYAVAVLETKKGKRLFGVVPCRTGIFARLIRINDSEYMLSEELILHFIANVFSGYTVVEKSLVRVVRSADIDSEGLYDEDLDYRQFMEDIIRRRKRLKPMRLELSRELSKETVAYLKKEIDVAKKAIFLNEAPLDLEFFSSIQDILRQREELFYPRQVPQQSVQILPSRPVMEQVREADKLLYYPFDSINPFLRMLREAAMDETVVSIKMTLYRVAKHSEIVNALCDAAENGKEVLVLVELKARFDEESNIEWSRRLEAAGCTVIYGLPKFKVHCKLCLISCMEDGKPRYVAQIGTGNYNEKTARLYTDYSYMTANQDIAKDIVSVFQALAKGETVQECDKLLVAPHCMQNRILEMIDGQIEAARAGGGAYIGFKVNSVTDKIIMDKLIEASQAGVKIDMVVRGICCLRAGIPGYTDNIRIVSIVGRFLEHSRIYIFGKGAAMKMYISSADIMTRNMVRRVEVAMPVEDTKAKLKILFMFNVMLRDNCQAREMQPDGSYVRVPAGKYRINAQETAYKVAGRFAISETAR